jgi:hypothetical protein
MNFCSLEEVLAACDTPRWSADSGTIELGVVRGTIPFSILRALQAFDIFTSKLVHPSEGTLQALYDGGSDGALPTGSVFTLQLPRVIRRFVVAKNLADLLSLPSATWRVPQAYFLVNEEQTRTSFCFTDRSILDSAPTLVKRYHTAVELWALLQSQADHTTETQSLMFFGIRRIEIEPNYGIADLEEDNVAIKEISDFVNELDRNETRKEIFRSVLSEFLRDQKSERAFAYLLRANQLFARRLSEGLAIYLSTNSPEKLTEKAVAKHFELAEKLEKVISGMEAKSLTIPAAVLLAVKEVKLGAGWVTLNTIIVVSAGLYFAAMTVAHLSQRAMLRLLKTTMEKSTKELRDQGLSDTNPVLAVSFKNLRDRRRNSTVGSWLMWIFSVGPLIAVIYAAFLAPVPTSPEVKEPAMRIIPANNRHQ